MTTARLITEAIDTAIHLGWGLAAWIAVLAIVATVLLLSVAALGTWTARAARRALRWAWAPLWAPHRAACASRVAVAPERAADGRTGRRGPSWARSPRPAPRNPPAPPDKEEAA
jgi:hypothetical protein